MFDRVQKPKERAFASAAPPARAEPRLASPLAAVQKPSGGCACGGGCPSCGGARASGSSAMAPDPQFRTIVRRAESHHGVPLSDVQFTTKGPIADAAAARGAHAAASSNVIAFPGGLPDVTRPSGQFAVGHELGHIADTKRDSAAEDRADKTGQIVSGLPHASGAASPDHPAPESLGGEIVQFGIFDPLLDFIDDPIGYALRADPFLNIATLRILMALPVNTLNLLAELNDTNQAVTGWLGQTGYLLINWPGQQAFADHLIEGLIEGSFIAGELLGAVVDVFGVNHIAHALFETSGALRNLSASEEAASRHIHPPGLIPYPLIRVDDDGIVARIAAISGGGVSIANQLFGTTGVQHRAVTTMHVIHTGGPMSDDLAAHELTHVAQYTRSGAKYMAQALHAQLRGDGYDYKALHGSLGASIAAGAAYSDFNREQQAQICQDYYLARFSGTPVMGGSLADLEHFVQSFWSEVGATWPSGGP